MLSRHDSDLDVREQTFVVTMFPYPEPNNQVVLQYANDTIIKCDPCGIDGFGRMHLSVLFPILGLPDGMFCQGFTCQIR